MASFVGSAPLRRSEWTVEEAARFAALKEFKLLQLLSTDKKALRATARRLGFLFGQTQTQPHVPAVPAGDAAVLPDGAADWLRHATHRRAIQLLFLVVLDAVLRAARSAQRAKPTQPQTQPPSDAAAAAEGVANAPRVRDRLISRRRRLAIVLLRVLARGGAAAPSVALGATRRRGGGRSAQTHSPSSSSCGSGGAR